MANAPTSYKSQGTSLDVLITKSHENKAKDSDAKIIHTVDNPKVEKFGSHVKFGFLTVGKQWEKFVDQIESDLLYLDLDDEKIEKSVYGSPALQFGFCKKVFGMTDEAVSALVGEGRLKNALEKKTIFGESALEYYNRGVKQAIAKLRVSVPHPASTDNVYGFRAGVLEQKDGNWLCFIQDNLPETDEWKSKDLTGIKATISGRLHLGIWAKTNQANGIIDVEFTLDFKMDTGDALFMPKKRIKFEDSEFDKLNKQLCMIHVNMAKESKVAATIKKSSNDEVDAFDLDGFDPLGEADDVALEEPKPKKAKAAKVEVVEEDEDEYII